VRFSRRVGFDLQVLSAAFSGVTRDEVTANYEHENGKKKPESNRLCDGLTTRVEGSSMFFQKSSTLRVHPRS